MAPKKKVERRDPQLVAVEKLFEAMRVLIRHGGNNNGGSYRNAREVAAQTVVGVATTLGLNIYYQ